MFEAEIDNQIKNLDYRLSMQGMSLELYLQYTGMTMEAYRDTLREAAEKQVKIRLALEAIAKLENLEVSDEDLEAEFAKFAEQYGMEVEKIKEVVPAEGLRGDLLNEKALAFVKDNAKVTTARKPRAKKEEAKADDAE